ncbi:MAG: hypothetical protein KGJ13_08080 [Patescibacteria group bacterium]|nr:hypothetical protein [Patescibacteria group bacterium]
MPLSDQYPTVYKQWTDAGGVEDNFRANLLALQGGPTPTAEDIAWLIGHTNIAIGQMQAALAKFGTSTGLKHELVIVAK